MNDAFSETLIDDLRPAGHGGNALRANERQAKSL